MRYIFILLFLVSLDSFAQASKRRYNQIILNGFNETPYIGVSYRRKIWLLKSDSISHFEIGGGIGWIPTLFSTSTAKPWSYSHSTSYIFGIKKFLGTINYSGIIAPRDRFFRSSFRYTPNPSVGVEFRVFGVNVGFKCNAYFYTEVSQKIINEKDLLKTFKSKVVFAPGGYLAFRF